VLALAVSAAAETTTATCVVDESRSVESPPHRVLDAVYVVKPLLCSLCKFTADLFSISQSLADKECCSYTGLLVGLVDQVITSATREVMARDDM